MVPQVPQLEMEFAMMTTILQTVTMMEVTAVVLVYSSYIVQIVNALEDTTLAMVSQVHQLEMEFAMMTTMLQIVIMMVLTAVSFSLQFSTSFHLQNYIVS